MADANRVYIFDTTLRDAEQTPGASLTVREKLEVAHQLARLQVDIIEAGFPVSSNEDFEAVRRIGQEVAGPVICGLSRAVPKDIERAGEALGDAPRPRIHTFIGTSDIHLAGQLRKGREEVLKMAVAAVEQAKSYCDDVEFSPMDAARTEPNYLNEIISATIAAGATTINIPDTVGYAVPEEFGALIARIINRGSQQWRRHYQRPLPRRSGHGGNQCPLRDQKRRTPSRMYDQRLGRAGRQFLIGRNRHGAKDAPGLLRF